MGETSTNGRTPALGQVRAAWESLTPPRTWTALTAALGGLAESLCLIRWPDGDGSLIIDQAGAQAVLVQGTVLAGASIDALTPGRPNAAREAAQALSGGRAFTVEDEAGAGVSTRRIARLYLPLDEAPPAIACAVVRIDG